MLKINNLLKHYGAKKALDTFSCEFDTGICGLLGPNGAGKSTLMKLMSDNLKRDSGEILYEGKDVLHLGKDFRRTLGYMPQQQGMYEDMTAWAFLCYIANLKGIPSKMAGEQIAHLLHVVNLSGVAHKKLRSFSGGMRQRVMLGQALLGNPQVIILDEPTVGLDPQERIKLCEYLGKLAKNRMVVWSTHIVKEIEAIADTIAIMKEGKLLAHGAVEEIISASHAENLEAAYLAYMGDGHE